ncbi:MAG: cysteine desulfurase NifS [delta proteobacterium ML8_D]|nr:MAG: cysteine desulfurase NifS [delta proteobacterium ML8_D]
MFEIYLDYNATTPVADPVQEEVTYALKEKWGNPSSGHRLGKVAKDALEYARAQVASLLNAYPKEIFFTSGGTESNNLALIGICQTMTGKGRHIITTCIEHPSIMNPCLHLLEQGWDVTFIKVNSQGLANALEVEKALRPDTVMVSVMLANNETGAIQPLAAISQMARRYGVLVHTDAAQALGKISVNVRDLGVDYLSIAGHKLYAPKGIGALYCKTGAPLGPIMFGGGQEQGFRPGTEPVPLAVGLGAACNFVARGISAESERQKCLREKLYTELFRLDHTIIRHGDPENTIPNTLSISFVGKNGAEILSRVPEVMASTGAACHDRKVKVSHVLAAMGIPPEVALGTVRFSLGRGTTESDIEKAARLIGRVFDSM